MTSITLGDIRWSALSAAVEDARSPPTKKRRTFAIPPSQKTQENRLLAEIYKDLSYEGEVYYRNEIVKIIRYISDSDQFLIQSPSLNLARAKNKELFFEPQEGKTYLVKHSRSSRDIYFAGTIVRSTRFPNAPLGIADSRKASLEVLFEGSAETTKRYSKCLSSILPISPHHPKASLLEEREEGGFYLKKSSKKRKIRDVDLTTALQQWKQVPSVPFFPETCDRRSGDS